MPAVEESVQVNQATRQERSLSDNTLTVAAAVASGIGVVGFATLVGGVVLWLRFSGSGVPADKAVAATPKEELLVLGAATLLPYLGAGLLAVVAAWLLSPTSARPRDTDSLPEPRSTAPKDRPARFSPMLAFLVLLLTRNSGHTEDRRPGAEGARDKPAGARPPKRRRDFTGPGILLCCEYALLLILAAKPLELIAGFLIGLLLLCVNLKIVRRSRSPLACAVTLFASVMLFGAALHSLHAHVDPKLQPAAVLRDGYDEGMYGFYVAETSDRVYLARPSITFDDEPSEGPRILVFPRADIVGLSVGEFGAVGEVPERIRLRNRARSLLDELCRLKASEVSTTADLEEHGTRREPSARGKKGSTAAAPCPPPPA